MLTHFIVLQGMYLTFLLHLMSRLHASVSTAVSVSVWNCSAFFALEEIACICIHIHKIKTDHAVIQVCIYVQMCFRIDRRKEAYICRSFYALKLHHFQTQTTQSLKKKACNLRRTTFPQIMDNKNVLQGHQLKKWHKRGKCEQTDSFAAQLWLSWHGKRQVGIMWAMA